MSQLNVSNGIIFYLLSAWSYSRLHELSFEIYYRRSHLSYLSLHLLSFGFNVISVDSGWSTWWTSLFWRMVNLSFHMGTEDIFNAGWLGVAFFWYSRSLCSAMPGNFPSDNTPSVNLSDFGCRDYWRLWPGRSIMDRFWTISLISKSAWEEKVEKKRHTGKYRWNNTELRIFRNLKAVLRALELLKNNQEAVLRSIGTLLERYFDETLGLPDEQVEELKAFVEKCFS